MGAMQTNRSIHSERDAKHMLAISVTLTLNLKLTVNGPLKALLASISCKLDRI